MDTSGHSISSIRICQLILTSLVLLAGCGRSLRESSKAESISKFQLQILKVIEEETNRQYAMIIHSETPISVDLTSGSNFYKAADSEPDLKGWHVVDELRLGAHRETTNSHWHLERTRLKTGVVSIKGSHSVRLGSSFDQTLQLTATNGSYQLGEPLRLGTFSGNELKLIVAQATE